MELVATEPYVTYECPNAHRLALVVLCTSAEAREGLGLHQTSAKMVDGLPESEIVDLRPPTGTMSRVEVTRGADNVGIESFASGRERLTEAEEEEAVGSLFIVAYNAARGTQFPVPMKNSEQDSTYDLVAVDAASGMTLRMQVRVADGRPWRNLNTHGEYANSEDVPSLFAELALGIKKKSHYDPATAKQTILLLDGWPAVPESLVSEFAVQHTDLFRTSRFREIWYVPRGGFGKPTCLFVRADENELL